MSFQLLRERIIIPGLCEGCGLCVGACKHIEMIDLKPTLTGNCVVEAKGDFCGNCYNNCPQVFQLIDQGQQPIKYYSLQSNDPEIRKRAASGGFVTTLNKYLLNEKIISKLIAVENKDGTPNVIVLEDPNQTIKSSGVTYGRARTLEKTLEVLKDPDHGAIGIVSVPCEIRGAAGIEHNFDEAFFKTALFCNASFRSEETDRGIITSPCASNCPAGVNAAVYIELIRQKRFQEALDTIRDKNPFPSVCGRICTNECEFGCSLHQTSNPLAVRELKKFLTAWEMEHLTKYPDQMSKSDGKKVAIIGAGPSGLTTAYYLALKGYRPTVFEKSSKTGGMLRIGVPQFRLPDNVLNHDIKYIESLGVDIKLNSPVGKDFSFKNLKDQGYEAFFLAIGLYKALKMKLDGENLSGISYAIDFLHEWKYDFSKINSGEYTGTSYKDKVVGVIGGGSVALDVAQTLVRLGAKRAIVYYRRSEKELPARREDYQNAVKEGVEFQFLRNPTRFIGDGSGKLTQIALNKMELGELDESNRRRPIVIENSEYTESIDHVIIAIGQAVDSENIDVAIGQDMAKNRDKFKINRITFETNIPGVFAGGDMIERGKNVAVTAIAHGREAAESIDHYLKGEEISNGRKEQKRMFYTGPIVVPEKQSLRPKERERKNILMDFDEIEGIFDIEEAISEAHRCLNCNAYCIHCQDFAGQKADISAGEVGSEKGFTTVLAWTDKGKDVIEKMISAGLVSSGTIIQTEVEQAVQKKMLRRPVEHPMSPREKIYQWIEENGVSTIPKLAQDLKMKILDVRFNALRLVQKGKFEMAIVDDEPNFSIATE